MKIGESIRSLRSAAGIMQRELADDVGISASMLSLVEAGKREPTIALLREIGRALDIPASILFAVALDESQDRAQSKHAMELRELTRHLLKAAEHSLTARRLIDEHASGS